jgi:hypothetical protein
MEDDLVNAYALEASKAMEAEAKRRIEETSDPEEDHRLRNMSLHEVLDTEHLVPALCARLGNNRNRPPFRFGLNRSVSNMRRCSRYA